MTTITKAISIALLLGALFGARAKAQTITAASCSESDVSNAIAKASSGDTVIIPTCTSTTPGGSNTWTTTLTITIPITLMGQGIGETVLIDGVPKGGASCSGGFPLISMGPTGTAPWRLTGFTIYPYTADTGFCTAHLFIGGGSHAFRVDHINMPGNNQYGATPTGDDGIVANGDIWGVIDHVSFSGDRHRLILAHAFTWGEISQAHGDGSWSLDDSMGAPGTLKNSFSGPAAIYVENSTCTQTLPNQGSNCLAGEFGARVVFRFNTITTIGSHGPETADRGLRQMEVYNNTFNMTGTSGGQAVDIRGGTGMVFNNTVTTPAYGNMLQLSYFRCNQTSAGCGSYPPWGQCNGSIYGTNNASWDSGDYPCLDGIGRGKGNLVSRAGCGAGNASCSAAAWPNEAVDPVYEWANNNNGTANPGVSTFPAGSNPIQINANKDFYASTANFTGASGVGVGTLANRPSACTANPNGGPGVGYWATDQGSWNVSGSGGQGQLYVCTATNTWSLYYIPYTYPHPLTTGSVASGTPPAAPTNLTVTVN